MWEYNNYAYAMAGLLVEKISGMEYETYVVENILKPLGVETPHPVAPSPEMVELMALPYRPGGADGEPTPVAQFHYDVYPAGDIFEIVVENGGLYVIMPRMGKSELQAETESRFWLTGEGWVFNFVAGEEGSIERVDFESDGLTMISERIEE